MKKTGWLLVDGSEGQGETASIPFPPLDKLWLKEREEKKKEAHGLLLIIAEENKAHFQKGLASATQLFQLT